ncbi:type VI secretion system tip protein TssI/VgrG [Escherichia coli]|uniref:type VI secretion system tip protein TssI/VgrG n=3 Tax=Escherichia coli TaxID=562 RepID=UPI0031F6A5A5
MSLKGLRFTLEVDGQEPDTFAVVSFRLIQNQSYPFVMSVDVASDSFMQTAEMLLEKNATLTIWQGVIPQRYVTGVVAGFGMQENNGWQMRYHLRIEPPLWRCGLRRNFRIFQQQDIRTISATLLNENGVTEWTPLFYEDHPAREFCVQYGESDLAFLARLWAEEGIFFFERFAADSPEQKLTLCDDVAGLSQAGELPFNPDTSAGAETECVSMFRYEAHVRPSSVQSQDYTFKVPDWPGMYEQQGENLNGQLEQYEIFDYPGRYKDEQHGKDFTLYQMDSLRSDAEKATGQSNSPKLWPGTRFTLTGHPQKMLNREWQVVQSILSGSQPQALHGSQGRGTTLGNQLEVIPADRTWRPRLQSKPKVDGPQSAIVTGPAGEEIFCDEHGRVRVKFHWDRYHGMTEESSCWVRVSQAWAGPGFGNLAIPRVGQEVIVDFLNGDPDQPLVMGRTYHEDNRSPGDLPGTKTQMTIRSKTYKGSGFNELRFEDATDKEQVYIHAQKNMDTEVLFSKYYLPMKVKDGKGDEYDAICKKPFRINSGNITLDYLGGSCPFEINTNPERWNTIKPGRSFLLSITLNDMYAFIPGDNYYFIKSSGYKFVNDKWFTLKSINNIFLYFLNLKINCADDFFDINNFTTCNNLLLDEKKHFFINQLWAIEDEKNSIYVTPDEISISIDGDNLKLPY